VTWPRGHIKGGGFSAHQTQRRESLGGKRKENRAQETHDFPGVFSGHRRHWIRWQVEAGSSIQEYIWLSETSLKGLSKPWQLADPLAGRYFYGHFALSVTVQLH
jgi:hypothetical protein